MVALAELEILGPSKRFRGMQRAYAPEREGEVLVKVFSDASTLPESSRYQFRSEAERYARLQHPNLVQVLAVDVDDEQGLYLVMEEPRGRSLGRRLREGGAIRQEEAVEIVTRVALALHFLHTHGLVHRNVAPRSIWVDGANPVLGDPALLRDLDPKSVNLKSGRYPGRPEIWAPEQVADKSDALTPATDVYGLGATLYALLTGEAPFASVDEGARRAAILQSTPPAPSSLRAGIPPELDAICLRCLEKDPALRYPSAGAVADDLGRFVRREPLVRAVAAPPPGAHPLLEVLVLLLALGSMVCVWLAWDARVQLRERNLELKQVRAVLAETDERLALLEAAKLEAEERLKAALAGAPGTVSPTNRRQAEARFNEGFAATLRGEYAAAIESFSAALERDPNYAKALVNRGYAYSRLDEHQRAIADFDHALAIDAGFSEAWSNRGNSRQALGQLERAIQDYTRAITIDPAYGRAYANRATAHYKLQRFEQAVADCDRALSIDPDDAAALACRGLSRLERGQTERGRADLSRSIELAPDHPRAASLSARLEETAAER